MKKSILHLFNSASDYHLRPIIQFFDELHPLFEHRYALLDRKGHYTQSATYNHKKFIKFQQNSELFPWLRENHHRYDLVILHGFFNHLLWELFNEVERLTAKTIWVVFGGELYLRDYIQDNQKLSYIASCRKKVMPKFYKVLTFTGDETLILLSEDPKLDNVSRYVYFQNFLDEPVEIPQSISNDFDLSSNFLVVGNSLDPSNRHLMCLDYLKKANFQGKLLLPVNYGGNSSYFQEIKSYCDLEWAGRYYLLTQPLTHEQYFSTLLKSSGFVFGHSRQQAGQHWLFALKYGLPIISVVDAPMYKTISKSGGVIYDLENLTLDKLSTLGSSVNRKIYDSVYSHTPVKELWLAYLSE